MPALSGPMSRPISRGVRQYLVGSAVLAALAVVAGCSHYMFAEREPWRRYAELACLNSGAVPESPGRVRISAISGPGICGMEHPIKVTELGISAPLGYTDEPLRPPGAVPDGGVPPQFSTIQSNPLPPPRAQAPYPPPNRQPYGAAPYGQPQNGAQPYGAQPHGQAPSPYPPQQSNGAPYGQQQYGAPRYGEPQYAAPSYRPYGGAPPPGPQAGAPMSLSPPGGAPEEEEAEESEEQQPYSREPNYGAPRYGAPNYGGANYGAPNAAPPPAANQPIPPLGPPVVTGSAGPVVVRPAATL